MKYYFPFCIFIFGFNNGFLILPTGNTLNFWLSSENIDIKMIGLFSLVTIPYSINFLWAPFFDRFRFRFFKMKFINREGWIYPLHFSISILFLILSQMDIRSNIFELALISILIAFLSSSQDVVLNAIRSEITPKNLFGPSSSDFTLGYRIGMILSGSLSIYLSAFITWKKIYYLFSLITFIMPFIINYILKKVRNNLNKESNDENVSKGKLLSILLSISRNKSWIFIILLFSFLVLYKLPDNFITTMLNPFLFEFGYSEKEISIVGKLFGMIGSIIGALIARKFIKNNDIISSLIIFGIIHSLAHLTYIMIIYGQKSVIILSFVTMCESITGGMAMCAYIALITSLCYGKYAGTQYSLMSSMMGASRTILPSLSGICVYYLGWINFYIFSSIMIIPSIIIALILRKKIERKNHD